MNKQISKRSIMNENKILKYQKDRVDTCIVLRM